ncbi:MAG: TVP38/TMEM64 family protein, partial [Candidatus Hodarchaeales archaeon]
MKMNFFIAILDSIFDFLGDIFFSLNEILVDLVETFGIWGLIFAMVFQAIVAPIISEAVLTAAGYGFYDTMGNEGLILALLGGIIGSLLGAIIAFYIARVVQGIVKSKIVDVYASEGEESTKNSNDNRIITRVANIFARFIDEDSEYFLTIIESRGFIFVLLGRLAPFIPFDAVSYGAGLTRISFWNYFIPTIIGTI